jgi:PKD repeat protein
MNAHYYLIFLIIVFGVLTVPANAVSGYYTIPVMALSNSPADSVTNYFGNRPIAPTVTTSGVNKVFIPTTGTIERVEIFDYSGTAGSNQAYSYYVRINDATDYLISTLSVNTNDRRFYNTSINIPVTAGDFFEIKRVHPVWNPNPATNIVGGYVVINASTQSGYVIPMQAFTSSPPNAATNYMGFRPIAPSTTQSTNKFLVPSGGNVTRVDIYDYSGTAGTGEEWSYYVQDNSGNDNLVSTLSVAANERIFTNTAMDVPIRKGDFFEWKRVNPTWVTRPATNIVGGTAFVDTTITDSVQGYPLFVQALTSSPADAQTVYFGNLPKAPVPTNGISKIYIPRSGTINRVFINVYSGTPGTNEAWSLYIRKNDATDTLIKTIASSSYERLFEATNLNLSVVAGDYIEIKGVQPTWATNPLTTIYGGYVFVDYGQPLSGCSGDIILPPVADFSANLTTAKKPAVIQFFDQSNNTVPGTTQYFWNFTNGGTTVDSTDINPIFTYTTNGTFTINHTISSGGVVSTKTKDVTILGGIGSAAPVASFDIVLTDTSTQYPTSWIWNVTNLLGNNTEVTYSTSQNPILNLENGNWRINLTATNAVGSNTTSKIIGWNLSSPVVYFWKRTS